MSPEELVDKLAEREVAAAALTDHDSVNGCSRFHKAAADNNIASYSGVEISTLWDGLEIHVVGLNIDHTDAQLLARLEQQRARRTERAFAMAQRLEGAGFIKVWQGTCELAGDGVAPGRAHFARYLVESGQIASPQKAFKRWLGQGKPAYVASQWCEMAQAVDWIIQAGGYAVLAHPTRYKAGRGRRERLLKAFAEAGGHAIEIPLYNLESSEARQVLKLTEMLQLQGGAGSDYHGAITRWIQPGVEYDRQTLPSPVWDRWIELSQEQ
ncbi:phosphatase [Pelagibaculum spongiae]|uniref:Phosphatase n=2 Tax=Pelagibaculum spongiae TaxID=2080658 RepID=A0A2V1H397_9GAMM|nr:phosphatase [Pelagibaculum spongiae]